VDGRGGLVDINQSSDCTSIMLDKDDYDRIKLQHYMKLASLDNISRHNDQTNNNDHEIQNRKKSQYRNSQPVESMQFGKVKMPLKQQYP
jgi:Zn-finger nucleic acid-binding protein